MINIWDFILNLNLGQWCGQGISFSVRGSVWISKGGTNSYIRVGVLPEEDISSVKFSSKEQSIFKVHVVVPEKKCAWGLFLLVFGTWCRGRGGDCYSWLCLLSGSEMLPYNLPGYLLAWVELSASINFGIGILCHESLSVDCVIEQPIGDWSHHSTALDQILLSKKDLFNLQSCSPTFCEVMVARVRKPPKLHPCKPILLASMLAPCWKAKYCIASNTPSASRIPRFR